jgi:Domain of unknown function (DUF4278)
MTDVTPLAGYGHKYGSGMLGDGGVSFYRDIHPPTGAPAMQLNYRGQSYETSARAIEVTTSGETATFMGRPYFRKQFTVAERQQSAATDLIYRGVRYTR